MQWYIAVFFLPMWAVAMASSHTFVGFVHILLGAAMAMVAYRQWKSRQDKRFDKGI